VSGLRTGTGLVAVSDATAGEIVGGELEGDPITDQTRILNLARLIVYESLIPRTIGAIVRVDA
jgi:hypothetical protein